MENAKLIVDVELMNKVLGVLGEYPFKEVNVIMSEIQQAAQKGLEEYKELTTPKEEKPTKK